MGPRVTVLQLDTDFPRIAGDVGCVDSYVRAPQIIRVRGASVSKIVRDSPQNIDIAPFEEALAQATGDVIVTSCGFLSFWQAHLASLTDRPFISSALTALEQLHHDHSPEEVMIVTFDAARLNASHLGRHTGFASSIIGLPEGAHLREVIEGNRDTLDKSRAAAQLQALVEVELRSQHRHILLECTNLPPYRAQIMAATGLPVSDILTRIEATCPGSIAPEFALKA
jgi:hypothetical protein